MWECLTSHPLETRQSLAGVSHIAVLGQRTNSRSRPEAVLEELTCSWTSVNYSLWKASKEMHGKVWKEQLGHTLPGKNQADWRPPPAPEVFVKGDRHPALVQSLFLGCCSLSSLCCCQARFISRCASAHSPATGALNQQKRLNFLLSGLSMLLTNSSRLTFKWEKLGFEASDDPCPIASCSLALFT